jgi:hypothetical protein
VRFPWYQILSCLEHSEIREQKPILSRDS